MNINSLYNYISNIDDESRKLSLQIDNNLLVENHEILNNISHHNNLIGSNKILITNDGGKIVTSQIRASNLDYLIGLETNADSLFNTTNASCESTFLSLETNFQNTSNVLDNLIKSSNIDIVTSIDTSITRERDRMLSLNISNIQQGTSNKFIVNDTHEDDLKIKGILTVSGSLNVSNLTEIQNKTVFEDNESLMVISSNDTTAFTIHNNSNNNIAKIVSKVSSAGGEVNHNIYISSSGSIGIGIEPSEGIDVDGNINCTGLYSNSQPFSYYGLSNIPSEFTPSIHTHEISHIVNLETELGQKHPKVDEIVFSDRLITIEGDVNLTSDQYKYKVNDEELKNNNSLNWKENQPLVVEGGVNKQMKNHPDLSYKYYVFETTSGTNSITFPDKTICDIIIIGGGGGGGTNGGGGGGGGGVIFESSVTMKGAYIVNVGSGGRAADSETSLASLNGNNTSIVCNGSILYEVVGGSGGSDSGGDGGDTNGYGGGIGNIDNSGGGGGGAGGAGTDAVASTAGNGGDGQRISIITPSLYCAGGGRGGSISGTAGVSGLGSDNYGGGGDGGNSGNEGITNGKDGVVIIAIRQQQIEKGPVVIDGDFLLLKNSSSNIMVNDANPYPMTYTTANTGSIYEFQPGSNSIRFPTDTVCDVLLVGGGGGTSNLEFGQKGNPGNLIYSTGVTIPAGDYEIIVGDGGTLGTDGENTSAFGATAMGGRGMNLGTRLQNSSNIILEDSLLKPDADYSISDVLLNNNLRVWYKFSGYNGSRDSSSHFHDATITGSPTVVDNTIKITKDDYLKLPSNVIDFDSDITISFWYRFDNDSSYGRLLYFSKELYSINTNDSIIISRDLTNENLWFIIDALQINIDFGHVTSDDLIHLTWVIQKNGRWIIYKNGVQIYNKIEIYPLTNTYYYSYLGKSNYDIAQFNNDNQISLKDFRIYNKYLSSYDINIIYNGYGTTSIVADTYEFNRDPDMYVRYKFDGDFKDSSGNYRHGTGHENPAFVSDSKKQGSHSLALIGGGGTDVGQHVSIPSTNLYLWEGFTMSFWVYFEDNSDNTRIVEYGNVGDAIMYMHVNANNLVFSMKNDGSSTSYQQYNGIVEKHIWKHFAITIDKSTPPTWKLYVNSAFVNSDSESAANIWFPDISSSKFRIGKDVNDVFIQPSITGTGTIQSIPYEEETYCAIFTGDGSITFDQDTVCDVLVVGGGGGGGGVGANHRGAGGGGAGEVVYSEGITLSSAITIVVGGGGLRGAPAENGSSGDDSSITYNGITITGRGGGGGARGKSSTTTFGGDGASGGGGVGGGSSLDGIGGSPVEVGVSGNSGGKGGVDFHGGGGGGFGGAGGDASVSGGGAGGIGVVNNITGTNLEFAGGGGGGAYSRSTTNGVRGGTASFGAGAAGSYDAGFNTGVIGNAAIPNTGSGGGGASAGLTGESRGGDGGSGIVIIRWKKTVGQNDISYFNGKIDDFRLYNKTLSPTEVENVYNDIIEDTVENDPEKFFMDTSDMLAWYKFDGDLLDSSGNGQNLTLLNGMNEYDQTVIHQGVSSLKFNGSTSYSVTPPTGDPFNSNTLTISVWHYATGGGTQCILSTRHISGFAGWTLYAYPTTGQYNLQYLISGPTWEYIRSGVVSPFLLDTWYHICVTIDENKVGSFYINSVKVGQFILSNFILTSSTILYVGGNQGGGSYYLTNGTRLDDVRIYNRALTQKEILNIYNNAHSHDMYVAYKFNGNFEDSSGNDRHATAIGNPAFNTLSNVEGTHSLILNNGLATSNSQYLSIPGATFYHWNGFSLSTWVYFSDSLRANTLLTLYSSGEGQRVLIMNDNGKFKVLFEKVTGTTVDVFVDDVLKTNSWTHIVLTINNITPSSWKLYVNNVLQTFTGTQEWIFADKHYDVCNIGSIPPLKYPDPVYSAASSDITASSSDTNNNFQPWKAFSGITLDINSCHVSGPWNYDSSGNYTGSTSFSGYSGEWLKIDLKQSIILRNYKIYPEDDRQDRRDRAPGTFAIFGSKDDTTYEKIDEQFDITYPVSGEVFALPSNNDDYRYYTLVVNKTAGDPGTGGHFIITEWELYGYPTEVKYPKVPYTSASADITYSSTFDTYTPYSAFDGNKLYLSTAHVSDPLYDGTSRVYDGTKSITDNVGNVYYGEWIRIDLKENVILRSYVIYPEDEVSNRLARAPCNFKIFGSNDNTTHYEIDYQYDITSWGTAGNGVSNTFELPSNSTSYRYYTLIVNKIAGIYSGDAHFIITEWELYGIPQYFSGYLDDFRIYPREISSREVNSLYLHNSDNLKYFIDDTTDMLAWYKFDGDFKDSSGNGKDLTYGSEHVSLSTNSVSGTHSAYLNGSQTNATTLINENIDLTGLNREFSIAYWIKREENDVWYIVSAGTTSSANNQ